MNRAAQTPLTDRADGSVAIHVIHLARATDRRIVMQAEFDRLGLTPADWSAADARDPAVQPRLATLPDRGPWGVMHDHAKGCLLSHLDALDRFIAGGQSHALLLEDDVFLSDDLPSWLASLDWWPADADVVKIERWRDDRLRVLLDAPQAVHLNRAIQRLRSRHSGTGGYIVSRAAAIRIKDRGAALGLPSDHMLFNMLVSSLARELVIYQINPALVVQGNDPAPVTPRTAQPKRPRPLSQKLRRGWAELRVLTALRHLVTGRARLHRITWQNRCVTD